MTLYICYAAVRAAIVRKLVTAFHAHGTSATMNAACMGLAVVKIRNLGTIVFSDNIDDNSQLNC